ncbi:MAG: type I 3-dehydroquinate dehydratase [Candidatus Methanoperedens sp.]|nr:type I 3-dehydroquinate dehydratase [Candidatus Methanoperedens sp.]
MVRIGSIDLNKSIAAVIGENPVSTAKKAKQLGADLLELRIDLLNDDAIQILEDLRTIGLPIIVTNRMKAEGGAWIKNEEERISKLISLIHLADAVDIELCADERNEVVEEAKRRGKTVLISSHDFKKTPGTDVMKEILNEALTAGADIAKLAVTPNSLDDVLRLLDVTLHAKGAVCTIAMGELGRHSRVIAPVYGSVLTYGYVETLAAPGQYRVDELRAMLELL